MEAKRCVTLLTGLARTLQEVCGKNRPIPLEVISGIVHNDSERVYDSEGKVQKLTWPIFSERIPAFLVHSSHTFPKLRWFHVIYEYDAIRRVWSFNFLLRAICRLKYKLHFIRWILTHRSIRTDPSSTEENRVACKEKRKKREKNRHVARCTWCIFIWFSRKEDEGKQYEAWKPFSQQQLVHC